MSPYSFDNFRNFYAHLTYQFALNATILYKTNLNKYK